MTFLEAMYYAFLGSKVRHKSWDKGVYILNVEGVLLQVEKNSGDAEIVQVVGFTRNELTVPAWEDY